MNAPPMTQTACSIFNAPHSLRPMKTTAILLTTLGLALSSLQAQTVPPYINYQGRVTDSEGIGLGTGTPVNRKIIFRVFTAATGGTRLWTEEQTVTIANGQFSVLLGLGIPATGSAAGEPRPAIDTIFTGGGVDRYLGITVDNGDNTINGSDVEIAPRQRITSTAFSFHAQTAGSVAAGSDLQLNNSADDGLGYYNAGRQFGGISVNGPVLYGQGGGALGSASGATKNIALSWNASNAVTLAGTLGGSSATFSGTLAAGSFTGNGSGLTSLNASSLSSGTVADARLSGNVVLLSASQTLTNKTITGTFTGNGAGLTTLNASNLSFGAVADGLLSGNVVLLNASQTLTNKTISGNGAGLTSLNASNLSSGTVADARLSGNVAIRNVANSFGATTVAGVETAQMTPGNAYGVTFTVGNVTGQYGMNFGVGGNGTSWIQGGRRDGSATLYDISLQAAGGNVGIGTTTPTKAKLEVNGSAAGLSLNSIYLNNDSAIDYGSYSKFGGDYNADIPLGDFRTTPKVHNLSIYASNDVAGSGFAAFSDARIKRIQGRSDATLDLATLLNVEITNYRYIDILAKGAGVQKKVIAQQVEKVFPQAVNTSTDVVPDIYRKGQIDDGWVQLATDLKVGERVRLIGAKEEGIHEVLEVSKDGFRTAFKPTGDEVFVYGREVTDFRTVDYDAIAMLNVSATQELARKLEVKDGEVKALKARLAELEAKDKVRDAKLAAIERMLSNDQPTVRTASLKQGGGAE